ncbi:hypothetical protein F4560_002756 [Saccharothrix ecbatanensis]|jgi:hypothetical protein|uniref:Uncharacterized protein n=1 Tax=Saccharothrix ecbatanensis TaxID=1105145 RepID=A0A7W9HJB8_9PSEU|nr:hypothetical protein [Saccharothrix ecbatanensis]MBB5802988.1 hypothetical protein [Saccharothrix ecbatanensis]
MRSGELRSRSAQDESDIAISSIAWKPSRDLRLVEWLQHGKRLGVIGRGAAWWIGDWVNYGNTAYGEKYSRAARVTGYDVQSLMNMAYVASRFGISRRRECLSWSHHSALAGLDLELQERWLDVAQERQLSVRGLRDELRSWRRGNKNVIANVDRLELARSERAADDAGHGSTRTMTEVRQRSTVGIAPLPACPNCGYDLQAD